ncbi:hypothetical protein [Plantactinospora sonchi]|uniref:Uncharacterized protein n=1 Tax=Plantactinospora sonchi TaxID=1544735 RepID=A0ABU7RQL6_9ACTN
MRETLDEFIGPSPESGINIDELARRGRRVRRRRRAGAVCTAGLAVAGLAMLAGVVGPGQRTAPGPPAADRVPTVASPEPTPVPAEPDRLEAVLKAAIAREAPQVTGLDSLIRQVPQCVEERGRRYSRDVPAGPGVEARPCPVPSDSPPLDLSEDYRWRGVLTSPTGTYHVRISIYPTVHYDPAAPPVDEIETAERRYAAEQGEVPLRGPNGENILAENSLLNMSKPDGTGIMIRSWDTVETRGAGTRSPFTAAQLTAIGLDPGLRL